mgnify:CR=1 FL=1|jgi:hypothetical protein
MIVHVAQGRFSLGRSSKAEVSPSSEVENERSGKVGVLV